MILALRLSNSGLSRAIVPSSVVQTGVKSFGCENRTPQELPSHSWKRILPSVVSASKSGAVSPIANVIAGLQTVRGDRRMSRVLYKRPGGLEQAGRQKSRAVARRALGGGGN